MYKIITNKSMDKEARDSWREVVSPAIVDASGNKEVASLYDNAHIFGSDLFAKEKDVQGDLIPEVVTGYMGKITFVIPMKAIAKKNVVDRDSYFTMKSLPVLPMEFRCVLDEEFNCKSYGKLDALYADIISKNNELKSLITLNIAGVGTIVDKVNAMQDVIDALGEEISRLLDQCSDSNPSARYMLMNALLPAEILDSTSDAKEKLDRIVGISKTAYAEDDMDKATAYIKQALYQEMDYFATFGIVDMSMDNLRKEIKSMYRLLIK